MRQHTAANSTQHAAHNPNSPIGRPTASRPQAPMPHAQNRTRASAHWGYSTKEQPAQVRVGPSRANSTSCVRSHPTCWSSRTSRHTLPSLPRAQHAHTPARARASRARAASGSPRPMRQLPLPEAHVAFTPRSDSRVGVNSRDACVHGHNYSSLSERVSASSEELPHRSLHLQINSNLIKCSYIQKVRTPQTSNATALQTYRLHPTKQCTTR